MASFKKSCANALSANTYLTIQKPQPIQVIFTSKMVSISNCICDKTIKKVQINPQITEIWLKKLNMTSWMREWHLSDYREAELIKKEQINAKQHNTFIMSNMTLAMNRMTPIYLEKVIIQSFLALNY